MEIQDCVHLVLLYTTQILVQILASEIETFKLTLALLLDKKNTKMATLLYQTLGWGS